MLRKTFLALLLLSSTAHAGLISHTDYVDGNVVTAAGQNSNENTIVNEINGNLNSANIAPLGVATSNIANNAVGLTQLATVVTSSLTAHTNFASYRRPRLTWQSSTAIDVENNTGTQFETCITFPDGERRCVTEDTGSTTKYRRSLTGSVCAFSNGSEQGGVDAAAITNNTWYYTYAIKSQVSGSNFVVCMSTNVPTRSAYSTLNTKWTTNGWTYLGLVRYGDSGPNASGLLSFKQVNALSTFTNIISSNTTGGAGVLLKACITAACDYDYTSGTSGTAIPETLSSVYVMASSTPVAAGRISILSDKRAVTSTYLGTGTDSGVAATPVLIPVLVGNIADSLSLTNTAGNAIMRQILFTGWIDPLLSSGLGVQL